MKTCSTYSFNAHKSLKSLELEEELEEKSRSEELWLFSCSWNFTLHAHKKNNRWWDVFVEFGFVITPELCRNMFYQADRNVTVTVTTRWQQWLSHFFYLYILLLSLSLFLCLRRIQTSPQVVTFDNLLSVHLETFSQRKLDIVILLQKFIVRINTNMKNCTRLMMM